MELGLELEGDGMYDVCHVLPCACNVYMAVSFSRGWRLDPCTHQLPTEGADPPC